MGIYILNLLSKLYVFWYWINLVLVYHNLCNTKSILNFILIQNVTLNCILTTTNEHFISVGVCIFTWIVKKQHPWYSNVCPGNYIVTFKQLVRMFLYCYELLSYTAFFSDTYGIKWLSVPPAFFPVYFITQHAHT